MEGIANFISMLDYVLDTKRKRHITGGLLLSGALLFGGLAMPVMSIRGGILLSASLLFGGLALTVMTIQNEEDEDE